MNLGPYGLLIKIGVVAALLGGAWFHGYNKGVAKQVAIHDRDVSIARQERIAQYETAIQVQKDQIAQLEADSATLQTALTGEAAKAQRLKDALARAQLVTHEGDAPPRLSRALRVCLNAATAGTTEAVAACEALGVRVPAAP